MPPATSLDGKRAEAGAAKSKGKGRAWLQPAGLRGKGSNCRIGREGEGDGNSARPADADRRASASLSAPLAVVLDIAAMGLASGGEGDYRLALTMRAKLASSFGKTELKDFAL
jgi:hypothetical protein